MSKPKRNKNLCKRCGGPLCHLCDDHERRVCIFCMDSDHRKLWDERLRELNQTDTDVTV